MIVFCLFGASFASLVSPQVEVVLQPVPSWACPEMTRQPHFKARGSVKSILDTSIPPARKALVIMGF